MSDKRYGGSRHSEREDQFFERRAKKKAMRKDHKDRWRFKPTNNYMVGGENDDEEVDDREGHLLS